MLRDKDIKIIREIMQFKKDLKKIIIENDSRRNAQELWGKYSNNDTRKQKT